MAGERLSSPEVRVRTNYMALVTIFVMIVAVGCAGFAYYYKDMLGMAASGVLAVVGVGCALLAQMDDGS